MSLHLTDSTVEGFPALIVESDVISLTILPSLGAKILSLVWKPTGFDYLWRQPDRPLRLASYGADFEAGDISGWDECFPTIGQCFYPEEPWRGAPVPDHGGLWSLGWEWAVENDALRMWSYGVRFPYRFERRIAFPRPGTMALTNTVEQRAPFPLRALWSMHPFFRVAADTQVILPEGAPVSVEVSKSDRLGGFLTRHRWPIVVERDGNSIDLSLVGPPDARHMDKIFVGPLLDGYASLFTPSSQHFIAFTFEPQAVPYVGLALMLGGSPDGGEPSYSVILEPCTGWPDRLDVAIARGAAMIIPGRSTVRWDVALHLGTGRSELDAVLARNHR
jgi:hypothetical protein